MSVRTLLVRRGVALAAALVALAATATGAAAERKPVLVVDGTPDGSGADAVSALDAQLAVEDALGAAAADVIEAMHRPLPPDDSWKADLAAALTETRADLARFRYREAADRAYGALDRLARVADDDAARKQLAELALLEGQALIGASDPARAETTLRLFHRLDSERRLDPARYLPEVITAYLAAGRPQAAVSTLHVTTTGADELLVDGVVVPREQEITVAPGPHLISARGEEILTVGRRVDAPPGQAIRVKLESVVAPFPVRLQRVMARLRTAPDDAALADAVDTLRGLARVKDAIVVVQLDGGLATRLYTDRGGLQPARPAGDPAVTVAPLRPIVRIKPPPPPPPPPPVEPWYRRPEGKVAIGAGVAVVLGAIVTAMVVRDPGTSTFTGKPTTP